LPAADDKRLAPSHVEKRERRHARLQTARASVIAQRLPECSRLNPSLELRDPLGVPGRLAVHRVLQPLDELFEVCDPSLQLLKVISGRTGGGALVCFRSGGRSAADLTDSRNQSFALVRCHHRPGRLTLGGRCG
jgi:hypothetical protein